MITGFFIEREGDCPSVKLVWLFVILMDNLIEEEFPPGHSNLIHRAHYYGEDIKTTCFNRKFHVFLRDTKRGNVMFYFG